MTHYSLQAEDMRARHRAEAREFRLMFYAAFLLFLIAGLFKRIVLSLGGTGRRSLVAEARAAANTCLPFAFMR